MKRTLSLVLALVMVLGTFTMAFAETATPEMEAGKVLEKLGVLIGDGKGDLGLEGNLKRQNVVVLISRMMGQEELAANYPVTEDSTYPDVIKANDNFYSSVISWAKAQGTFEGKGNGMFGFDEFITAQSYAKVLLTVLGYEQGVDFTWENALVKAKEMKLVGDDVKEADEITVGTAAVMTHNTLLTELKDGTETLASKLGYEIAPVVPTALEVKEVVANNLKEVKVMFNQKVDADTVTDANISVKDEKGTVSLMEDGMTAVVTLTGSLTNQKEYTLTVEKVKTVEGLEIVKVESKFKPFDATLPTALSVEVTGPRNLTVTFSEPLDKAVLGTVSVKQDKATLGNTVAIAENKATVTVFTNFVEGREYTVTVEDFKDYAGYKNVINTLSFTYEKDENPPVASIDKVEQKYVVVSFDKPVKGLAKDKFYHTFTAWEAVNIYKDAAKTMTVNSTDSVSKVYVYFYEGTGDKAIPAGNTLFGILGSKITDNWGNALGNKEFTISATADRTAPEVKSLKVEAEDQLSVTFTKDVKFSRSNVEVLDADGKKISGVYITTTKVKDNEYTIGLGKKLAGKTVTVSIKDVKDTSLYENVLSLYTEVITITDKSKPTVTGAFYKLEDKTPAVTGDTYNKTREVYVQFNETVDPDTALLASNYSLVYSDNSVVVLTEAPSFDAISSRVKIQLTKAQANILGSKLAGTRVQVINVKDTAGNAIVPVQTPITSISNVVTYTLEATGSKQIVAKFSDLLSGVKPSDFKITVGSAVYNATLTQENNNTTTLTFDLEKAIPTNVNGVSFTINANDIKNSYGNGADLTLTGVAIEDKVKPEVVKNVDGDYVVSAPAGSKYIYITFSEAMKDATFSTLSFSVEGRNVTAKDWTGNTLRLTVDGSVFAVTNELRVSYQQKVTDLEMNELNLDLGTVMEITVK